VFREGLNTDGWVFRVSVFICFHLWLRTNTETLPRQLHALGTVDIRGGPENNLKSVWFRP
jgi:hypothetical protein